MPSSLERVHQKTDDKHTNEDDHTPIEISLRRERAGRPERPKECEKNIKQPNYIYCKTESTKTPTSRRQRFGTGDLPVNYTADRHRIGVHERRNIERDNRVECNLRADVDERQQAADHTGECDGSHWDSPMRVNSRDPVREW